MKRDKIIFRTLILLILLLVILRADCNAKNKLQAPNAENTAENYYAKGNILKDQKKYPEAVEAFKKAISLNASHAPAHLDLATVYARMKDYDRAVAEWDIAAQKDKNLIAEAYPRIIFAYLFKNDIRAVKYLNDLFKINPQLAKNLASQVYLARIYGIKETDEGFTVAHYFVGGSTDRFMEFAKKADIFIESGKYDNAIALYKEFSSKEDLTPKEKALALYTIGSLYSRELSQPKEGVVFYKQALALDSDELDYRISLVDAYRLLQEYDKALDEISKMLEADPNSKYGLYFQGVIYLKKEEWKKALESWDNLKKVDNILFAMIEDEYDKAKNLCTVHPPPEDVETKIWENETSGLRIKYPKEWFVKEMAVGEKFQVFFSAENIDINKYYRTGIAVIKETMHLREGVKFDGHVFVDFVVEELKGEGARRFIWEHRYDVTTNEGASGVLAKIKFVNLKGETEIEWLGIYAKGDTRVSVLCEAPAEDFYKYDSLFKEIIMDARLF